MLSRRVIPVFVPKAAQLSGFNKKQMGTVFNKSIMDSTTESRSPIKLQAWPSPPVAGRVGIVSFNMLAPCYRRLSIRNDTGRRIRESHALKAWENRASQALAFLEKQVFRTENSIIALQEFWLEPTYRERFDSTFSAAGYTVHTLQRKGGKADGLALLVKDEEFALRARHEIQLAEDSDRIALILWLTQKSSGQHLVVANTHLSFPHSEKDSYLQLRQVCAELND